MDANGVQLCFVDNKSDVYVFDPINEAAIAVPDCPDNIDGILWDQNIFERAIFAVYNKSVIVTYIFVKYFIEGKSNLNERYVLSLVKSHISDYIVNRYQSNKNKYDEVAIRLSAFINVFW